MRPAYLFLVAVALVCVAVAVHPAAFSTEHLGAALVMGMAAGVAARVPSMAELAETIAGKLVEYDANPNHPDLIGKPEGNPVQIRPAFPDAATFTRRLLEGAGNAAGRYAEGVRAPRAHFLERAKAANQGWKNGVNAAVAGDRFLAGLNKVNPDEAIETAATLGAASYVAGIQGRQAKIQRVMNEVAPAMAAAVGTVRGLPANTDAEREARAVAMIRAARAVGLSRRGGK